MRYTTSRRTRDWRPRSRAAARPRTNGRAPFAALVATTAAMALALTLGACGSSGGLGEVLGSVLGGGTGQGQSGTVVAQIESVNTSSQVINIVTQDNQRAGIYYDNQTQVVYQNQQYPVTALERGDQVQMQVQQTNNGDYYTNYIAVTQSVSTTNGGNTGSGQLVEATGQVSQIDHQNGWFDLSTQNGTVRVQMPYNSSSATVNEFNDLDRGNYVRLQGYVVGTNRLQLYRFL